MFRNKDSLDQGGESWGALADLHIMTSGLRIDPSINGSTASFSIPAGARNLVLICRSARPADVSDSSDQRQLGVCLERLAVKEGETETRIPLDHPSLLAGLHEVERGVRRWTTGRTPLANWLFPIQSNGYVLIVGIAGKPFVLR